MNCIELNERLADYLGGELDPVEAEAVDAHLAGCAACRAEVANHRQTLSALGMLDTVDSAEAARQTRSLVVITRRPPWMRWGLVALRTAAVLAAGVVLGRVALPQSAPPVIVQEPPPVVRPAESAPTVLAAATSPVHPRWIALARECGRGEPSFACQLAILAESARQ